RQDPRGARPARRRQVPARARGAGQGAGRRSPARRRSRRGGRAMRRLAVSLLLLAACRGHVTGRIQSEKGNTPAPKLDPGTPEATREFEAAVRALRLGGPEAPATAKARFEQAVKLEPKLWEARHDLGVIDAREGDDEGAIAAFGHALDVVPRHAPTR